MAVSAGVDIGSATVKLAVMEDGRLTGTKVLPAGGRPGEAAQRLLAGLPACPVFATGYGRDLLETAHGFPTITEIKAHAAGARFLFPDCTAVIDIGGQDLKIISLDARGRVAGFEMNDRCAAGTGRFLEVMAARLGFSLEIFGSAALAGKSGTSVSSMCTVFAETEAVGLLNRGIPAPDIALALHASVAKRIAALFRRLSPDCGHVALTGGGALNPALVRLVGKTLGISLRVSPLCQVAGAIGCAKLAAVNTDPQT